MSRRAEILVFLSCAISVFVVESSSEADDLKAADSWPRTTGSTDHDAFQTTVLPFLTKNCTSCHGPNKPKGGLNLAAFRDESSARSHLDTPHS